MRIKWYMRNILCNDFLHKPSWWADRWSRAANRRSRLAYRSGPCYSGEESPHHELRLVGIFQSSSRTCLWTTIINNISSNNNFKQHVIYILDIYNRPACSLTYCVHIQIDIESMLFIGIRTSQTKIFNLIIWSVFVSITWSYHCYL